MAFDQIFTFHALVTMPGKRKQPPVSHGAPHPSVQRRQAQQMMTLDDCESEDEVTHIVNQVHKPHQKPSASTRASRPNSVAGGSVPRLLDRPIITKPLSVQQPPQVIDQHGITNSWINGSVSDITNSSKSTTDYSTSMSKNSYKVVLSAVVKSELFRVKKFINPVVDSQFSMLPNTVCGFMIQKCNVEADHEMQWWTQAFPIVKQAITAQRNNVIKGIKRQFMCKYNV